jgi:hypothetical protein
MCSTRVGSGLARKHWRGWKDLLGKHTLAYLAHLKITTIKSYITLAFGLKLHNCKLHFGIIVRILGSQGKHEQIGVKSSWQYRHVLNILINGAHCLSCWGC